MLNSKFKKNRGFTLIEMMVAVAIFSLVLVIALGAILTILDSNRKARTLTEVMNNLNFSLEMITRSLKTGVEPGVEEESGEDILHVSAIVLDEEGFNREKTRYRLFETEEGRGYIAQCVNDSYEINTCPSDDWIPITSELVDIDIFDFTVSGMNDFNQPRTQLYISGNVRINQKIASNFAIQTTVSQRKLNLEGSELVL